MKTRGSKNDSDGYAERGGGTGRGLGSGGKRWTGRRWEGHGEGGSGIEDESGRGAGGPGGMAGGGYRVFRG